MTYLSKSQVVELGRLLRTFFALPYSTDLDGKDAETLIRMVKGINGPRSKRKELFDIIDGDVGYSVKTLRKSPTSTRVDLQEQRFCDVEEVRSMRLGAGKKNNGAAQGRILLKYMHDRISEQMKVRGITTAKSLILLKHWDKARTKFSFLYWEEDFLGFVDNLRRRDAAGEVEWIVQEAGLHARDLLRPATRRVRADADVDNTRLIRMHYKHNQIFTDHDIPAAAQRIDFAVRTFDWTEIAEMIEARLASPLIVTPATSPKSQAA